MGSGYFDGVEVLVLKCLLDVLYGGEEFLFVEVVICEIFVVYGDGGDVCGVVWDDVVLYLLVCCCEVVGDVGYVIVGDGDVYVDIWVCECV